MWHQSRFLAGCLGGALAVASVLVGLEVSATTVPTTLERTAPMVNRSLKSDRMPVVTDKSRSTLGPGQIKAPPVAKPELLVGCEPVVSAIGQPPLARVAGRCVS
jgi:hypothetical protein